MTLVEVVVCVLIVGLLAAATHVTLGGVYRSGQQREAVEVVRQLDHAARLHAPSVIVVEDGGGALRLVADGRLVESATLPTGATVADLRTPAGETDRLSYSPHGPPPFLVQLGDTTYLAGGVGGTWRPGSADDFAEVCDALARQHAP